MLPPGPRPRTTTSGVTTGFARGAAGLLGRFARAAVIFVVLLFATYLVVGNALLLARVPVRYFESGQKSVRISYDAAWTWWPGAFWAEDLVVAIQQRGEELEVRADEASATIPIADLVRGTFRVSGVDAEQLAFRYRKRRDDRAAAEAAAAMLPLIPAFGPLALKDGTPKKPPPSDADYDLWRVVVEVDRATVREVWVEGVRISGPAAVQGGGLDFKPHRWLKVPRSAARFEGARLERMGQPEPLLLDDVRASAAFAVPFFALEHDAIELLRFCDLDVDGDGLARAGAWLTALDALPGDGSVAFDGSGPLTVRAALRQGKLRPGSRAAWDTVHLDLVTPLGRATTSGRARVEARAQDGDRLEIDATTAAIDLRLLVLAGGVIHAEGTHGTLRLRAEPHLLAPAFDGARLVVPASNLGLAGLSPAKEVRFERGIAYARGAVDIGADGRIEGEGATRIADLAMAAAGMKITGTMESDVRLEDATLGDHLRARIGSTLRLTDMGLAAGEERVSGWWATIDVSSSIERRGAGPVSTQVRIATRARDAAPARAMLEGANDIPGIVGGQLTMEGLVATGLVESHGPRVQVDLQDAQGDGARVRGRLVESGDELRAAFLVETTLLDVGVALARKKTEVQVLAGEDWLAEETAFLGRWKRPDGATRGRSSEPIR